MKKIPGRSTTFWTPNEVLWAQCFMCDTHIAWRKKEKRWVLLAWCCGYIFVAKPVFDGAKYEVGFEVPENSNVIYLTKETCESDPELDPGA